MKDFSDAHCDKEVGGAEGTFGHFPVESDEAQEVEITNAKTKTETKESTSAILKGTVSEVSTEITCTTVSGTAKSTNKEVTGVMQNEGTSIAVKYSGCTVNKPSACKVKESIEMTGSSITVENLGGGKNEMGLEIKPKEKTFAQITYEGTECSLKGKSFTLEGTLVGTGSRGNTESVSSSGGTLIFTNAMSAETLKLGGKAAEFSSTVTVSLKEGGKPLTLTTGETESMNEDTFKSDSGSGSTFLTGEGVKGLKQIINIAGLVHITCSTLSANGMAGANEFKTFTLHPIYNSEALTCTWDQVRKGTSGSAKIETPKCDYVFENQTDANKHAGMKVECEGGNTIKIIAANCTIKIESQSLHGVRYENENLGKPTAAIKASFSTEAVEKWKSEGATCTSSLELPEKNETIKKSKWYLLGDITLKGYVDNLGKEEEQTGIWFE